MFIEFSKISRQLWTQCLLWDAGTPRVRGLNVEWYLGCLQKGRLDLSVTGRDGMTFVQLFAHFRSPSSVQLCRAFLSAGTDPNVQDTTNYHNTVLHALVANEDRSLSMVIMSHLYELEEASSDRVVPFNFQIVDSNGCNILVLAAKLRQTRLAGYILRMTQQLAELRGVPLSDIIDINCQDKQGRTAFHYACMLGMKSLCDELNKLEVEQDITDSDEQKAVDLLKLEEGRVRAHLIAHEIAPDRDVNATANFFKGQYRQTPINLRIMPQEFDVTLKPRLHPWIMLQSLDVDRDIMLNALNATPALRYATLEASRSMVQVENHGGVVLPLLERRLEPLSSLQSELQKQLSGDLEFLRDYKVREARFMLALHSTFTGVSLITSILAERVDMSRTLCTPGI